jgi:hypothetical protein
VRGALAPLTSESLGDLRPVAGRPEGRDRLGDEYEVLEGHPASVPARCRSAKNLPRTDGGSVIRNRPLRRCLGRRNLRSAPGTARARVSRAARRVRHKCFRSTTRLRLCEPRSSGPGRIRTFERNERFCCVAKASQALAPRGANHRAAGPSPVYSTLRLRGFGGSISNEVRARPSQRGRLERALGLGGDRRDHSEPRKAE